MKELILLLSISLIAGTLTAQSSKSVSTSFWNSQDAYFGQKPPGDTPQVFAKGLLVDSGIVLGRVSFSADGKEFYYTSAPGWFKKGARVNQKAFRDGHWQKPVVLFEEASNPALSANGLRIYLGGSKGVVRQSRWINNTWSIPETGFDMNYGLYNFQPTSDTSVFYAGSNGTQGTKNDFSTYDFCKIKAGQIDTTIESLDQRINTPAFDGDFYIAPDQSYLIISAKESPTYECELWISFKQNGNRWSAPKSLGIAINNGVAHRFGQYVTPDGRYLIYTQGTSEKDCNLYWVRFDRLLKKLKSEQ